MRLLYIAKMCEPVEKWLKAGRNYKLSSYACEPVSNSDSVTIMQVSSSKETPQRKLSGWTG